MFKIFILLFGIIYFHNAQSTTSYNGAWWGTFVKKQTSKRNAIWAETQIRYNLDFGAMAQFLYRTGLLRSYQNQHEMGLLYGFIQGSSSKEHRFALQHVKSYGKLLNFDWSTRTRLEHRLFEDNDTTSQRFRFLLRAQKPVSSNYNLAIWNELFLNLSNDHLSGNTTTDRNRFFIGLNQSYHQSKFEFGYLNQYVPRSEQNTMEHLLVVYLFI